MAYIKRNGNGYDKAAAPDVPQPWEPLIPVTPDELPAFTASDKEKVLAVNEAGTGLEWTEASGGGGGATVFNLTAEDFDGETYYYTSSAFDADDVLDAYFSGSPVMVHFPAGGYNRETVLSLVSAVKVPVGEGTPSMTFGSNDTITFSGVTDGYLQFSVYVD